MKRNLGVAALVLCGLLLIVGAMIAVGAHPMESFLGLLKGSLGSSKAISDTLQETTPLLIAGLAVFFALRAGLFNIGVEGQLNVGACACAFVALKVPGFGGVALGTLAGIVGGALWALPAGWIKAYKGGHEVITTIMLNNVAGYLTLALVAGPLKAPDQEGTTTANLAPSTNLPALFDNGTLTISSGLVVGILAAIGLAYWLKRTVSGYELRAAGANPTAAAAAGVSVKRVILQAMLTSGAIAGFAGAVQVLAFTHRFYADLSSGYGFDALGVALLAGQSALLLVPSALLFGILAKGGTALQINGVPKSITTIVLGVLIIIAAAIRYRKTQAVES